MNQQPTTVQNTFNSFGSSAATNSPFGANSTPFGSAQQQPANASTSLFGNANQSVPAMTNQLQNGTTVKPFQPFQEKDNTTQMTNVYQSISCMPEYRNFSFEELRYQDYQKGTKFPNGNTQFSGTTMNNSANMSTGGFGTQTNTATGGLFNQNQPTNTFSAANPNTSFGASNTTGGLFGKTTTGQQGTGMFGQQNNATGNSLFGQQNNNNNTGGGLFGQKTANPFGSNTSSTGTGVFGQQNTTNNNGLFGQQNNQQTSTGLFGQKPQGMFGNNTTQTPGNMFGMNNTNTQQQGSSLFGQNTVNNQPQQNTGLFGQNNMNQQQNNGGHFGQKPQTNSFGNQNQTGGGLFGNQPKPAGGLFGQQGSTGFGNTPNQPSTGLFGQNNSNLAGGSVSNGLFGQNNNTNQAINSGSLFGQSNANQQQSGLFGQKPTTTGLFGANNQQPQPTATGLFGANNNQQQSTTGGLFGNKPQTGGLFGNNTLNNNQNQTAFNSTANTNPPNTGGLFGNKPQTGGTGLFGNTSNSSTNTGGASLFGNNNGTSALGGTGGGLFNNLKPPQTSATTSTQGTGLFGNKSNTTSTTNSGGLFGNNASVSNSGGLFGGSANKPATGLGGGLFSGPPNNINQNQGSLQTQQQLPPQQGANNDPYGTDGLFSRVVVSPSVNNPETPVVSKTTAEPKKKINLLAMYKESPRPLFVPKNMSKHSNKGNRNDEIEKTKMDIISSDRTTKDRNLKTIDLTPDVEDSLFALLESIFHGDYESYKTFIERKRSTQLEQQKPKAQLSSNVNRPSTLNKASSTNVGQSHTGLVETEPKTTEVTNKDQDMAIAIIPSDDKNISIPVTNSLGIHKDDFSYVGDKYYISPSLDTLTSMSYLQLLKVKGLIVGHEDYGKIEFLEPVDLSNISLTSLCGDIIRFSSRTCLVGGSDEATLSQCKGIDVAAKITCYRCYPKDRSTRKIVNNPDHQIVKRHIEKLKRLDGRKYENYNPLTGEYTFSVQHAVSG